MNGGTLVDIRIEWFIMLNVIVICGRECVKLFSARRAQTETPQTRAPMTDRGAETVIGYKWILSVITYLLTHLVQYILCGEEQILVYFDSIHNNNYFVVSPSSWH